MEVIKVVKRLLLVTLDLRPKVGSTGEVLKKRLEQDLGKRLEGWSETQVLLNSRVVSRKCTKSS